MSENSQTNRNEDSLARSYIETLTKIQPFRSKVQHDDFVISRKANFSQEEVLKMIYL